MSPPSALRKSRRSEISFLIVSIALLMLSILVGAWTLQGSNSENDFLFNGDPLWPASLYEDVVVDGFPYSSFMLPGANSFFPDVGLYFLIRTLMGNVRDSMELWLLAMGGLLVATSSFALAAAAPAHRKLNTISSVVCSFAFMIALNSWWHFKANKSVHQVFLPVHHGGAVSCAFLGLAITYFAIQRCTTKPSRIFANLLLALLCTAIVASDRLFLVWFSAPMIFTLWIALWVLPKSVQGNSFTKWQHCFFASVAILLGSVCGMAIARFIHQANGDTLQYYASGAELQGILVRVYHLGDALLARCLAGDFIELAMILWFPLAMWIAVHSLFSGRRLTTTLLKNGDNRAGSVATGEWSKKYSSEDSELQSVDCRSKLVIYCWLCCAMLGLNTIIFLMSSASTGVLGIHPWPTFSRYFMAPQLFSVCGLSLLLVQPMRAWASNGLFRMNRFGILLFPISTAILLASTLFAGRTFYRETFIEYPSTVRRVDEECERLGLEYGLGDYAQTRFVSLLSKRNIKVRPYVYDPAFPLHIKAFHHTTNASWFWQRRASDRKPVQYEFILVHKKPDSSDTSLMDHLTKLLGEPAEKIDVGNHYWMLVYNRPDDILHSSFTSEPLYLNCEFRYRNLKQIAYPGGSLLSLEPINKIEKERTAIEGRDKPGVMAFGPYLIPPENGRYRVVFRTSSSGTELSNGVVYVLLHVQGGEHLVLGTTATPVGSNQEVQLTCDVSVGNAVSHMEFQTVFTGKGSLTLHEVVLERTEPFLPGTNGSSLETSCNIGADACYSLGYANGR